MTTTVKINSSSIAKLKSAISSTDINAKKKLIAEVFVLAYGYEKVSKTTFEILMKLSKLLRLKA